MGGEGRSSLKGGGYCDRSRWQNLRMLGVDPALGATRISRQRLLLLLVDDRQIQIDGEKDSEISSA